MPRNIGFATDAKDQPLSVREFDRAPVGAEDVRIDITHCGVCHSDVHQARDEFGEGPLATNFPCMPGHEIVGTVAEIGNQVSTHSVGDRVGVGCMVYWGSEDDREATEEQYQATPSIFTYNALDPDTGEVTFGGYSDEIVVNSHFVLKIPDALPSEKAAPILCAGVTTWSPLDHYGVGAGMKVGVAGVGGLGHLAIALAKARGADTVVALTRTPSKADAAKARGADAVIVMDDDSALEEHADSFDFILSTIPTAFDMNPYLGLVKHDGRFHTVGMLEPIPDGGIDFATVSMKRLSLSGSLIGSIQETQEVLDFCAEHDITAETEVISIQDVNGAFDAMVDSEVRFRYVIDSSSLKDLWS